MKKETYANKLVELFGLQDKVDTTIYSDKPLHKRKKRFAGISEEQIQEYRHPTAFWYFLQAPELFSSRVCKHCEMPFLVSRHQVAFCGYDCVERQIMQDYGVKWTRKGNIELMVKEVFDGNEPLWITNLDEIERLVQEAKALIPEPEPEPVT